MVWRKLVMPSVYPKAALLIIDVQNDFINGTMALIKCPAKQEGSDVVPVINNLIHNIPFDVIAYSLDWHPANHCSFIENVNLRKLIILITFLNCIFKIFVMLYIYILR